MTGGITYQACRNCTRRWYLPRERCPHCGSRDIGMHAASGGGTLFAVTTVHRAPDAAFRDLAPYSIALVDLDEGPRIMAHLQGEAAIGDRLAGGLETIAGKRIPLFRPARSGAGSGTQ